MGGPRGAAPGCGVSPAEGVEKPELFMGQNRGHPSAKPSCCGTLSKCLRLTVPGSCSVKQLTRVPTGGGECNGPRTRPGSASRPSPAPGAGLEAPPFAALGPEPAALKSGQCSLLNLLTRFFVPTWLSVLIETSFLTRPRHFRCTESRAQKGFVPAWAREGERREAAAGRGGRDQRGRRPPGE